LDLGGQATGKNKSNSFGELENLKETMASCHPPHTSATYVLLGTKPKSDALYVNIHMATYQQ